MWCGGIQYAMAERGGAGECRIERPREREGGGGGWGLRPAATRVGLADNGRKENTDTDTNSQDGELARKGGQARKEEKADGEADQSTDVASGKEEDAVPTAHCRVCKGQMSAGPPFRSISVRRIYLDRRLSPLARFRTALIIGGAVGRGGGGGGGDEKEGVKTRRR